MLDAKALAHPNHASSLPKNVLLLLLYSSHFLLLAWSLLLWLCHAMVWPSSLLACISVSKCDFDF